MNAFRRSLRGKIFAVILLASLLPFLAAVWLLARSGETNLREAAQAEARTAGALARSLADERTSRLVAFAQAIALTPGLGEAVAARDRTAVMRLVSPWSERLGGATIAVTDERGVMVLRAYAPDRFGDDMTATTKGLLPALRGEPSFSTEAAGLRGLAIRGFGPILVEGKVVGVAAVTQNLDQEFLTGLRDAAGFETFAVFPDGSTVGAAPAASVAEIVGGRAEYTGLAEVSGREQAIHAWPLADPTGTVVGFLGVVFPLDNLTIAGREVRETAAQAGLLAVLAAACLGWLLSRALIQPVERITGAARSITGGAPAAIPTVRSGDELEELSTALGSMVATLSEQAQRLEELNARLAEERGRAQALAEASRTFAEARLDVDAVLAAVAQRVAELFDGGCIVRELSPDGRWLTPVAIHHTDPDALAFLRGMLSAPQRVEEGINGKVVRTGETQFLPRLTPEQARATMLPEHWPYLDRFGVHSLLIVPLLVRGRTIGTLAVQRTVPDRPFVDEDRLFLRDLAARAALAIDSARLYAEAQAAVRARDQFLSIAAHELRTPITTVKGQGQVLLRALRRGSLDPARLERSLEALDTAANRLTGLTDDLLDVGRIRTGQLALRLEDVDVAAFARGFVERFQEGLDGSHRLVLDAAETPCPARVDVGRVEQVFANLLDNAVKYSPEGGEVRVEVRREGEGVAVTVRDAGIGLPSGAEERIFAPFGRAPNATARHLPGMGLGLFISRGIVERHGGQLRAESRGEGQGTSFFLWLPCEPPAADS